MKFLLKFALLAISLILFFLFYNNGQYIQLLPIKPVYDFNDYQALVVFLGVLIVLNTFVKPILKLFTLPLTCLTFGLFSFVVNFIIVYMADKFVDSFQFTNWKYAFIFSIIFSLAGSVIDFFLKDND
jgi:putative membrane protein